MITDLGIGTPIYQKYGKTLTASLRHADTEMYRAKQSGDGLALIL